MRLACFVVLILVMLLATWKGPHAKAPAPELFTTPVSISVTVPSAP